MKVSVHRLAMSNPADTSGLRALIDSGELDPRTIVATIGKTEGNGGANDFTRALATISVAGAIGRATGETPEAVAERVALVWSGGCEGVLSPHVTVIARDDAVPAGDHGGGLAVSVQRTRDFRPEEIGTLSEVDEVAEATRRALDDLSITEPGDVHYVQVKGPLLTPAGIKDATTRGARLVTTDPNGSKAYARGATALGVAIGLREVERGAVTQEAIAHDFGLFSRVASTSAGGELTACEIVLFANSPAAVDGLRIGHAVLRDVVDADGVVAALASAGLEVACRPDDRERGRIAAVFAKAEASPNGEVRGRRTTMLSDADINYERHARAALGAVIASVTGDPAIFVSGGTEHQCPPGEAPIAAIVRTG
ncbi:MAG TPA: ring-opening amidohydrolase [Candidatus Limnocylindrales bacterium]|nr:ring-opening amidohydrolase [Candidatus Limnocylindrales bacterium]